MMREKRDKREKPPSRTLKFVAGVKKPEIGHVEAYVAKPGVV
jgi:hypothetical protein